MHNVPDRPVESLVDNKRERQRTCRCDRARGGPQRGAPHPRGRGDDAGPDFEGTIEFVFVDGDSEDATRSILEELAAEDPRIRIADNPKRLLAAGLNVGLAEARGEFIVEMQGHAFYPPHYVSAGVERLRRGGVDWVSGRPVPRGVDPWSRRVTSALGSWLGTRGSGKWMTGAAETEVGGDGEAELDTGVFCGAWRRETLERFGGRDEDFVVNSDSELAARVLAAGGKIVTLPELSAIYVPRSSLKALARQYYRYGYFRAKTARLHAGSMRRSHVLPPILALASLVALGPGGAARAARLGLGAYAAAVLAATMGAEREGPADLLGIPGVFATMHFAWGFGYLRRVGALRTSAACAVEAFASWVSVGIVRLEPTRWRKSPGRVLHLGALPPCGGQAARRAMEAAAATTTDRPATGGAGGARSLSGDKAQRIIEAMRESVAEVGVTGSTFDRVSGKAGVSRGLLHYYFGTKERLLVEVIRRDTEVRIETLGAALDDATPSTR